MNINKIFLVFIILISAVGLFFLVTIELEPEPPMLDADTPDENMAADMVGSDYVGLTTVEAVALAQANETMFRVVEVDGHAMPATKDFRPGRINAAVKNNIVTSFSVEGEETPAATEPETPSETVSSNEFIGMTTAEAEAYTRANDTMFRVVEIDGEMQAVTEDFRPGRINASTKNDVVVSFKVEGADVTPQKPADSESIIGMTTADAQAYAETNSVMFRIGAIDGEFLPVTMDYRPGRITAEVENGIVIDYSVEE